MAIIESGIPQLAHQPVRRKRGRPAGDAAKDPTVFHVPSRCPRCQSTRRTGYTHVVSSPYDGIAPDNKPYTTLTLRRCRCGSCNFPRVDRVYEYVPKK